MSSSLSSSSSSPGSSPDIHLANTPSKQFGVPPPDYTWVELHSDLETGKYVGAYGADNAAFHGLAALRANVDMNKFHAKKHPSEFYEPALEQLLKNPITQARWKDLVTIDPMGMFASRPTIAATSAKMLIPELVEGFEEDDKIINKDRTINCMKVAVDYVWNLPGLARRLHFDETAMRAALADYTENPSLTDPTFRVYLPPVGGLTIYFVGDITKLADPATEVAVRCHDACCGSDVFGTDICTCRPYLIYAIQGVVECAKRGGVGIIAYFKKEGRSLGEVTKFRVYNARKNQVGGDTAENYFKQTEAIAGIRDARFQEMMADVLIWLGVRRIDWLLSMSSDKYDAIISAGIEVMQRVPLPDSYVPSGAVVEITAKIASGYHTDKIESHEIIDELRQLSMIRERCGQIYQLALHNKTRHWGLDLSKLPAAVDYVEAVTRRNYPDLKVPYHSRWRHFRQEQVDKLVNGWHCDRLERTRRLIDLVTVSVLLDAGAGPRWHYLDEEGQRLERSEGLAVATFDMFKDGLFSSDMAAPHRVNSYGLRHMSFKNFQKGFQIGENNPMVGLEGRFALLQRLGKALDTHPEYFGYEMPRPGNVVDFVLRQSNSDKTLSINALWKPIIEGLESIWPDHHAGVRRGDVWVYSPLKKIGVPASDMIPFHKLSQWLTYSVLEPIEQLGYTFTDLNLMTGLAEYRNGGLFIDTGVLVPKKSAEILQRMEFDSGSELIVEWRALTVCLIDKLAEEMRVKLKVSKEELPLAKVLQGGTWAAGREAAFKVRGNRTAPLNVRSDGTVF